MHKLLLVVLLGVLVACGHGFDEEDKVPTRYQNPLVGPESLLINLKYIELLNQKRAELGLRPLTWNLDIEEIAFSHSKGMGLYTRPFGHSAFDIRCRRIRNRLGLRRNFACAEVVAKDYKDYKKLLNGWLHSPEHRASLLHPDYTHTALGIYRNREGRMFWTQMLIKH